MVPSASLPLPSLKSTSISLVSWDCSLPRALCSTSNHPGLMALECTCAYKNETFPSVVRGEKQVPGVVLTL